LVVAGAVLMGNPVTVVVTPDKDLFARIGRFDVETTPRGENRESKSPAADVVAVAVAVTVAVVVAVLFGMDLTLFVLYGVEENWDSSE
jgi:hypothetical protein